MATVAQPHDGAITVDVEDYFHVSAFEHCYDRSIWDTLECRIERNVERILERFSQAGVRGTFFTLGWVAERYPQLVRRIADGGHEIASHGAAHVRIPRQTPQQFRNDVEGTRKRLEDVSGRRVIGYRAASFSLDLSTPWAYDVLRETGHGYSSSVYPVAHDHYGRPDAPRFPYPAPNGLWEIPLSTLRLLGRNWPCSGGGYFRLYPYALSRFALRRIVDEERERIVFYFHPWELDPDQPRTRGAGLRASFRHYCNLSRFEPRLVSLLSDFRWGPMEEVYDDII